MVTRAEYLLSFVREDNAEEVDDPDFFNFRKQMTPKEQHKMDRTSGATTNGRFKNFAFATKRVKRFDDPDPEDLEPGKDLDLDDDGDEDVPGEEEEEAPNPGMKRAANKNKMLKEHIKRHIEKVKRQPVQEFIPTSALQSLGTIGTVASPLAIAGGAAFAAQRAKKARELKIRQGGAGGDYDKAKADLSVARKKQISTLGLAGGKDVAAAKLAKQAALNKGLHKQAKLFSKTPPQGHGEVHVQ